MTVSTALPHPEAPEEGTTQRDLKSILIPVLLVVLGLAVMVYPVVATQWNNVKQQRVASEYAKLENSTDPEQLNTQLEAARNYNDTRNTGPILDPWLAKIAKNNNEYQDYLNQLSQFDAMARLVVPTGQINLPVYHGTDEHTLQTGVGHLFGSDLPVGGESTHTVLTGHTGLPNATLFDNLKDVKEGDAIYLQVSGVKLKYEVDQIKVVLPNETDDLRPVEGKDFITLVTCTPYGINSHRLLVRGHQVPMDDEDIKAIEDTKGSQWQWWMWALLVGALVVAVALIWWIRRQLKQRTQQGLAVTDLIRQHEEESNHHE